MPGEKVQMTAKKTLAMVQTGVRELEPRDLPIPDIDADSSTAHLNRCCP